MIRKVLHQEHRPPHPMGLWELLMYLMPVNLQAPKTLWLQGSDVRGLEPLQPLAPHRLCRGAGFLSCCPECALQLLW